MTLTQDPPRTAPGLLEELEAGRVRLGSTVAFRPWATRKRRLGEVRFNSWDGLYSPYQILLIRDALDIARARPRRAFEREWRDRRVLAARQAATEAEIWIAALMALEPWYYPRIVQSAHVPMDYGMAFDEFDAATAAFEAKRAYQDLGWGRDDMLRLAEGFIWKAHALDPLQNWTDLVALIHPSKWDRLEGEALLSIEYRKAGELLLRFLEELGRDGVVMPLPTSPFRSYTQLGDRLRPKHEDLDRVLNDYGISPHPAVVLLVEGETERFLFTELMKLLNVPRLDSFIRIELLGGVDKEIELLAKHLAPALRASGGTYLDMLRPPTRLLLAVDAEKRYSTPERRDRAKSKLADHLFNALDPEFQNEITRSEMDYFVHIETWSDEHKDVEFSHFTDRALAKAVLATQLAPADATLEGLTEAIRDLRAHRLPIDKLWNSWPVKPKKPDLWKGLWRPLRARIKRAQVRGTPERIPVVRVLFEAYRLAARPRRHVVIKTSLP
jgi:hypothetical protein